MSDDRWTLCAHIEGDQEQTESFMTGLRAVLAGDIRIKYVKEGENDLYGLYCERSYHQVLVVTATCDVEHHGLTIT